MQIKHSMNNPHTFSASWAVMRVLEPSARHEIFALLSGMPIKRKFSAWVLVVLLRFSHTEGETELG